MKILELSWTNPVHLDYDSYAVIEDDGKQFILIDEKATYCKVRVPSNWADLDSDIRKRYVNAMGLPKLTGEVVSLVYSKGTRCLSFYSSQLEDFEVYYFSTEGDTVYVIDGEGTIYRRGSSDRWILADSIPSHYRRVRVQPSPTEVSRLFGTANHKVAASDLRQSLLMSHYSRLMRLSEYTGYTVKPVDLPPFIKNRRVRWISLEA